MFWYALVLPGSFNRMTVYRLFTMNDDGGSLQLTFLQQLCSVVGGTSSESKQFLYLD